ncbi:hypothetical protein DAEQUDRAFT_706080 [Daedalea quercina L-15889]|uniref:Uncharacterized protein n=1 Tax=Daedalea quercina L-15889 TaxID=1314783 RepID=A0A165SEH9_9APHY|nr:hypothetical protein DAEQUDRAFT_706080 [Daedalea quercina L-15889]
MASPLVSTRAAPTSTMSPLTPTIANILGPSSIGIILASMIYGVNCLQAYLYYTRYSNGDGAALRLYTSCIIRMVDSSHVILLVMAYYHYTVTCFGDLLALSIGYPYVWLDAHA